VGAPERAQNLELLANASWERVPFDTSEAPVAVLRAAESETCYRVAGDREGAQRAAFMRELFEAELARRFRRAKLVLEVARRRGDFPAVRHEIGDLLALSSQIGVHPYRTWLERLDRAAEAELLEAKAQED
jgi:hypothetical protein